MHWLKDWLGSKEESGLERNEQAHYKNIREQNNKTLVNYLYQKVIIPQLYDFKSKLALHSEVKVVDIRYYQHSCELHIIQQLAQTRHFVLSFTTDLVDNLVVVSAQMNELPIAEWSNKHLFIMSVQKSDIQLLLSEFTKSLDCEAQFQPDSN
ncbi:hypothetical protein [Zooshikella ganghwensis]|uniref:Uncharacterized protein n=1 Tax=Zooshikella ganghwensis TaxID=202772 RepID=A0A4P9VQ28_9GAMM|nr:hypothetical protein [Zooshikella ganghwensis]RDH44182.1 hypothetical protein B9G39_12385 [Zooshikella ganghwensis]